MIEEERMIERNNKELAQIARAMSDEEKSITVMNISTDTLEEELARRNVATDKIIKEVKDYISTKYSDSLSLREKEEFIAGIREIVRVE